MKKSQSVRWNDQTLLLASNRGARFASVINHLKKSGWLVALIVLLAGISYAHETTYSVEQTIAVGSSPLTAVITPNGLEVYVSNYGSNTVSVISTKTDTVVAIVPVGFGPDALAVSPDGSFVYVGQHGGDVSVINTATKVVSTISAGTPVRDLALTPDGSKLYLAMEFSGLKKVDTSTNSVAQVSSITCPEGVAVTPDGKYLYVNYQCFGPGGSSGHDAIGKFDVASDALIKEIVGLPNVGSKITVSRDGKRVWASNVDACSSPSYDHVGCPVVPQGVTNVIDTATDTLIESLAAVGRVAFAPKNSFVSVGGPQLLLLKPSTALIGVVSLAGSGSMAVTRNGQKAYVPVPGSDGVVVLHISGGKRENHDTDEGRPEDESRSE
jgi:YVTN family beta-propeller protein